MLLAHTTGRLFRTFIALHLEAGKSVRKRNVMPLSQCAELLKVIEATFNRHSVAIAETLVHQLRQIASDLGSLLEPVRLKLQKLMTVQNPHLWTGTFAHSLWKQSGPSNAEAITAQAALQLMQQLLHGTESWSHQRRVVLRFATDFALKKRISCSESEIKVAASLLWQLDTMVSVWKVVRTECDCSLLYWVRELISPLLQELRAQPSSVSRPAQHSLAPLTHDLAVLRAGTSHSVPLRQCR